MKVTRDIKHKELDDSHLMPATMSIGSATFLGGRMIINSVSASEQVLRYGKIKHLAALISSPFSHNEIFSLSSEPLRSKTRLISKGLYVSEGINYFGEVQVRPVDTSLNSEEDSSFNDVQREMLKLYNVDFHMGDHETAMTTISDYLYEKLSEKDISTAKQVIQSFLQLDFSIQTQAMVLRITKPFKDVLFERELLLQKFTSIIRREWQPLAVENILRSIK